MNERVPDDTAAPEIWPRGAATSKLPEVTRRRFLQSAAVTSVSAIAPSLAAAQRKDAHRDGPAPPDMSAPAAKAANPIVPNFKGTYGGASISEFQIPKRPMGSTGLQVSILGMGGFHLGTVSGQEEVNDMVAKALDHGLNFFDNAWEYHQGISEERLGAALKGKRDGVILMTKVCTHGRKKDVAMQMLEESLNRLQTDHLDVWQVHEVIYENDPDLIFAPG